MYHTFATWSLRMIQPVRDYTCGRLDLHVSSSGSLSEVHTISASLLRPLTLSWRLKAGRQQ